MPKDSLTIGPNDPLTIPSIWPTPPYIALQYTIDGMNLNLKGADTEEELFAAVAEFQADKNTKDIMVLQHDKGHTYTVMAVQ